MLHRIIVFKYKLLLIFCLCKISIAEDILANRVSLPLKCKSLFLFFTPQSNTVRLPFVTKQKRIERTALIKELFGTSVMIDILPSVPELYWNQVLIAKHPSGKEILISSHKLPAYLEKISKLVYSEWQAKQYTQVVIHLDSGDTVSSPVRRAIAKSIFFDINEVTKLIRKLKSGSIKLKDGRTLEGRRITKIEFVQAKPSSHVYSVVVEGKYPPQWFGTLLPEEGDCRAITYLRSKLGQNLPDLTELNNIVFSITTLNGSESVIESEIP